MIRSVSSAIVNENVKLKIAGYAYSIIFGLTFSVYPAFESIAYSLKTPYVNSLGFILFGLIIIEIITLPILLISPNLKKTIGITIFFMGIADKPEEIKWRPALKRITQIDLSKATKQALLEMFQVSLPIMAPGSVLFIGRWFIDGSVISLIVGLIGICAVIASFSYILHNKLVKEKEKRVKQFQKAEEKLTTLYTNWSSPEPMSIYFEEE